MSTVPGDTAENTLSFLSLNPAPVPEVDERLGEELLEAAAGERPQRADAEVVALLLLQQRPERPVGSGGDADLSRFPAASIPSCSAAKPGAPAG
jgi:hypothetical protein